MCAVAAYRSVSTPRFAASSSLVVYPGRGEYAVDVARGETRVGDRVARGLEHQLDRQERRPAHVVGLANADDRGPTR